MMLYEIQIDVLHRALLPRVQHVIIRPPLERHPPFAAGQNGCRTLLSSRSTSSRAVHWLISTKTDMFGHRRMTLSIAQQKRE
jgi:hypothetical protein